ncbi:MAG TPA: PilN domain-containing protein [Gemmatimonadales bacterium]
MMISVNLRPGIKRGRAKPAFGLGLDRVRALGARLKDPLPALAVAAWVVALGFLGWTFFQSTTRLASLEPRLAQAREDHKRFQDFLRQKRREEATRDSILAQIRTIRQVDGDRYMWPHIMDEVAQALPPYTWLVDVSTVPSSAPADTSADAPPPPVEVQLTGRTVDIQGYTRFMRGLEDSPWLTNVAAVSANTVVEQGRAITAFVLKAEFSPADSGHIRTVPVAQSVMR